MSDSVWNRHHLGWLAAVMLGVECLSLMSQIPGAVPTNAVTSPQFQATSEQVGDALMAHQRYQAAIESYKAGKLESATVWNKMGVAYQLMLNVDDAERCYAKAMKLEPKNAIAINNMGSIYMARKNYGKAEGTYRKALKIDPGSALVNKNLGTALLAERKYKKGWASYQSALAIDPAIFDHSSSIRVENPSSVQDRGAMNFYMAKSCAKAGLVDRAVDYLRMALNEGFTTPKKIMADTELAGLRTAPAFQQLLASQGVSVVPTAVSTTVRQ